MGIEFYQTGYGKKFLDGDFPRLVKNSERIAKQLENLNGLDRLTEVLSKIASDKEEVIKEMKIRKLMFDKILDGSKTSTSRNGHRKVEPGEFIFTETDMPNNTVRVIVTAVTYTPFCELTAEEAKLEGYANRGEMMTALKDIYGEIQDNQIFTLIKFRRA